MYNHGILKLRQCMQHFEFWLRARCWSNKSFLIFQFILSCRFFRLHCKHQIFNILQYFKYISDYFWLGVCILNGNERINWRKYIYSQYNPYKKVSLYRKPSQCSYFMINKGLKKSAKKKKELSELSHLNSSFMIGKWILNIFRNRSTYRKSLQKQYPTII